MAGRGNFRVDLAMGRVGERVVGDVLKENGFYVLITGDFSGLKDGKVPSLCGAGKDRLPMPDMLVCKEGNTRWFEAKVKKGPAFYRKAGIWTHGVDTHKLDYYRNIQKTTGIKVDVGVLEIDNFLLVTAPLDVLERNVHSVSARAGKTFFPRDVFEQRYDLTGRYKVEEFARSGQTVVDTATGDLSPV